MAKILILIIIASLEELQLRIKRKNDRAKAVQQQKEEELLKKIKLLRERYDEQLLVTHFYITSVPLRLLPTRL
jgi:hypothetical protein